ncbi:pumilio homolog 12 [Raphanus sativus]|uniref:Pumilio homolog 12 n=1 Tax=Raphanus sativus TaxID=3726 RepID=A0A6J0MT49_RAPSA|nr:pumilio homolog 12 [Raphanus sativus]XP_056860454.1 pumilio homolog 12 [Raphanus sativus]XP_056860455.1 pumilio homolog 12 [Raphanus sativus]XP_056860456.1 pumilio homolog 12 [Raphanus sativus]XP_056860457.1 pumilio homolog 12 [Raphanus sativus]XP_056860458.1 pumilio homolog 12 [Raphanus sativus]
MDHRRRNDPEFDEFEKLLGEIPKVTSGNDYTSFPICFSSSRSSPDLHLPGGDDSTLTSAFAEGNFNFGMPNQTLEFPRVMSIPANHFPSSSPCVYFRNAQPQRYMPSSQAHHHQALDHHSHIIHWRNSQEGRVRLQEEEEEQYMPVLEQYPRQFKGMYTAPGQEHFDYHHRAHDGDESLRSLDGVVSKRMYYPEKILMRSPLGLNTAKLINYGVGDLAMSLNNLTLQPPKYTNSLAETKGKIYQMAKDQHGCRFLQRKFAERDENDIEIIFNEIIDYISELMVDPFGNYLVQKLLEVCSQDQRMQIVHSITRKPGVLIKISCDMHGTRVVQKMVETVKRREEIAMIMSALKHGVVILIKNVNGNHVVQRCLQYLLPHCEMFLFEVVISNCVDLATDQHGCCVLQKCLGYSKGEQKYRLVFEIASNALLLSQHPFGNYVIQYILDLQLQWAINGILEMLEGNYTELSMQKCSSNVVEKCLRLSDDKHRARIIRELINFGRLDQVMLDPYGNYVVQSALKQSKGTTAYGLLVDAITLHVSSLRTNSYGKKVLSALCSKK